jgi:hypothetical protein
MITKIYLVTNCFNDPNKVYIGKTKNSRKNDHKRTYGEQIEYTYIDEVNSLNRKDWEPLETYWIQQFMAWGFEIVNIRKKGGNGPEFQLENTKKLIGAGNFGIKKPGVSDRLVGRTSYHKENTGDKISKTKKEWFENNTHHWGSKISKSMTGKQNRLNTFQPQSAKDKMSELKAGIPRSDDVIQKMKKPRVNKENFGKHRIGIKTPEDVKEKQRQSASKRQTAVIQEDKNGNFITEYPGINEASRQTGCYVSAITMCCKGKLKSTKGFVFKYKI